MIEQENTSEVTIKWLLASAMADIDIFLLREKNQIDDKNQTFTAEEIRTQLRKTFSKMCHVGAKIGFDLDKVLEINVCPINELNTYLK